ncbi:hypothetical protein SAMN04487996_1265 [Dyadobacter soli]|uniref:Uncharacterized protein n=1 Tax=Dyadobacter soli TaxID=659014 RepID=A0A1G7YF46_9BACT|nr:hypothetical protein [Dyadobacter soli]SDG94946.1 hypothetical protein SAMN04487996_1265 [Dyadobacter soli]
MKQHFSASRLLSATLLFVLTLAMSCTKDHVIPEPVSNCNRTNGQPRAFPCEFEIQKLDFMSGSSNVTAFETLTPTDSLFERKGPYYTWHKTGTETFNVTYKVRLTFKRIAEAPKGTDNQYNLYLLRGGTDSEDFINWDFDINTDNMAVGQTRSQFFYIEYDLAIWSPSPLWMQLFAIVNRGTNEKLKIAPYNYASFRDRAESWIRFKATN